MGSVEDITSAESIIKSIGEKKDIEVTSVPRRFSLGGFFIRGPRFYVIFYDGEPTNLQHEVPHSLARMFFRFDGFKLNKLYSVFGLENQLREFFGKWIIKFREEILAYLASGKTVSSNMMDYYLSGEKKYTEFIRNLQSVFDDTVQYGESKIKTWLLTPIRSINGMILDRIDQILKQTKETELYLVLDQANDAIQILREKGYSNLEIVSLLIITNNEFLDFKFVKNICDIKPSDNFDIRDRLKLAQMMPPKNEFTG